MSDRVHDLDGWYEIARNPLSRAGVFPYSGASIGAPDAGTNPGKIYMVLRPQEELNNPETMDSARLKPWVDDHTMLGNPEIDPALTPAENKGVHGAIGEKIEYDPASRTLFGNLKIWSQRLADAINAGKKELSMGFRCMYEFAPGEFEGQHFDAIQRNIRFNHLALVDQGRMGPGVAVLDHLKFSYDSSELRGLSMAKKTTHRINLAKKMGVAPAALDAALGLDAATIASAGYKATMDAEEDADESDEGAGGTGMTLEDITDVVKSVAGPLGELNQALAEMAGAGAASPEDEDDESGIGDDMEPVLDAGGNQVMENGKPKMQKKVAPAAAASTDAPGMSAMDGVIKAYEVQSAAMHRSLPKGTAAPAALVALDAAITSAKTSMARIRSKRKPGRSTSAIDKRMSAAERTIRTALDHNELMRNVSRSIAARDLLAKKCSTVIGSFDAAEMTEAEVAKYAIGKLGITGIAAGQEISAVNGYLHNRTAPVKTTSALGLDSATPNAAVSSYLSGAPVKAA